MTTALTVRKFYFVELYFRHRFRADLLACYADVPEYVVYDMLANKPPVKEIYARQVLDTISKIYGQNYSLENVQVKTDG